MRYAAVSMASKLVESTAILNIAVPLPSLKGSRTCGPKAAAIGRLARLGLTVPDGFGLGFDAYRAHLWSTGIRHLARGKPDGACREALRSALVQTKLPAHLRNAVRTPY